MNTPYGFEDPAYYEDHNEDNDDDGFLEMEGNDSEENQND